MNIEDNITVRKLQYHLKGARKEYQNYYSEIREMRRDAEF